MSVKAKKGEQRKIEISVWGYNEVYGGLEIEVH